MNKLNLPARFQNCLGCAGRRQAIKRIIKMPLYMNPEWLPSIERDNWVAHRDRILTMIGWKGKSNLRHFQRGNFAMFPAGTQAILDSDCTFTASTIPNITDFSIEPTNSFAQARLHSDGDWYSNAGNTDTFGSSEGTWQGGCAVADYDTRWNRSSGTVPTNAVSGSDGVWSAATTSKAVGYGITATGVESGSFNVECRDGASLNVLFTDAFTMGAEVDPGC